MCSSAASALDGYGAERWRPEPDFAVRIDPGLEDVGVLMESTRIVAKVVIDLDA
jgi:glucose 1-dehydrogenase